MGRPVGWRRGLIYQPDRLLGGFFAALFVAIALLVDKKISWIPALLLAAFGWELQMSHTMPYGPIAFTC